MIIRAFLMHTAIVTTKCPISPVASKKNIPLFLMFWLMRWSKDSLTGEPKYPPSTHKRLSGVSHKSSNAFPGCGLQRLCYSVRIIHVIVKMPLGGAFAHNFQSGSLIVFHLLCYFTEFLTLQPSFPSLQTVRNPWHILCLKNTGGLNKHKLIFSHTMKST